MSWKWFGVKTLYRVTAEGEPKATDERFDPSIDLVEERVVLIRARSHEEAHRKGESEARKYAGECAGHRNPFGQYVRCRLIEEQVACELFEPPGANEEVWSDTFLVDKVVSDEDLIAMCLECEVENEQARRTNFVNEMFSGRVWSD